MSEPTLPHVHDVISSAVAAGRIPGAVVLVRAGGDLVHQDARGTDAAGSAHQLSADSILWLASLSKPVCAAALLMLADQGKVDLNAPVSRYIPEFAQPGQVRVIRPGTPEPPPSPPFGPPPDPAPVYDLVPADREITPRDLLTHTSGLQSIFQYNPGFRHPLPGETLASYVPVLAGLVRDFQPGTRWAYSNAAGFDVLARITEVASGRGFDALLRDSLLDPLGATDLGFGLGGSARAVPLEPNFATNPVPVGDRYYSGAAGMWGSAAHYLRFAEFLAAGRAADGRELMSAAARGEMTANQSGDLCPGLNGRAPSKGIGFGYGVAVVTDAAAAGLPLPDGTFGWDGIGSRRFWVGPSGEFSMFMYAPDPGTQQEVEAAVAQDLRL